MDARARRRGRQWGRYARGIYNVGRYGTAAAAGLGGARYFGRPGNPNSVGVPMAAVGSKGFRKKARYVPKQVSGLKKQVKELRRVAESDMGTLIYRDQESYSLKSSENLQNSLTVIGSSVSILETVIAQLRYYNPSSPTTLVTADGASGTYQKEFYFKRNFSSLNLRNNYQVPCKLCVYICVPKEDTSITPNTAWTNGLNDQSNGDPTNLNVYPTDSSQFNDLFRIVKSVKKHLAPGKECTISHSGKKFQYDPSLSDSHALAYQPRNAAFIYLIVVEGVIGHDSTADEQGILQAGVDIIVNRTFEVRYSAGADIKYVYVASTLDTFTNGGVVSNDPVADNQSYSIA